MCGITGLLDVSRRLTADELRIIILKMAETLAHRGPDDRGEWVERDASIALAHRRLSILDLSPQGHQPMGSVCGRYIVVFNGEVYNFKILRKELENLGHAFRGGSDTEVVLASIGQWGVEAAVKRFIGMFAFALWDRKTRLLHLIRDRLGIKPLYYVWKNGVLLFGSELKALRASSSFKTEINRDALSLYLRHNYVPAPYTIYEDTYKLPPGTILTVDASEKGSDPIQTSYWSMREVAGFGAREPFMGSVDDAIEHLDALLRDAVKLCMVADVPLGAFLSGGVDSSTVVALMQVQSDRRVQTFSIGFEEAGYDEAVHAKAVARHIGTEHTELYVTAEEAMAVIPKLPIFYDEPFSDASQIPTFLVSQLARKHVTVSLSGDGGDELFAGYNRHLWAPDIWSKVGWMPTGMRLAAARAITAISPQTWDRTFMVLEQLLPRVMKQRTPGDKLHKLAESMGVDSPEAIYRTLISHWKDPESVVFGAHEPPTVLTNKTLWADMRDFVHGMMYMDTVTYLPDDVLVKLDRASMSVSLEARVPLLDHRLVEFAWQLPLSMKIRDGQGKWLLRKVLDKYVPKELIERPKTGFEVPIASWLRGPLRDWAAALLDEKCLREQGFFDPSPIRRKWEEHLSGARSWQYDLWNILMFQAWKEQWT